MPRRKKLPHDIPSWVQDGSLYFITVNARPRGTNQLATTTTGPLIWDSVVHNVEHGMWWPRLLVLMPDHLHGLISFPRDPGIKKTISNWKHFTAHTLGIRWQRDFFEHRLRSDESFDEKAHYIRMNPVRQGLCFEPGEWPYVWSMPDR